MVRIAGDLHALMRSLGLERYFVAARDRGARVAHRLALDQPQAVRRLALIDTVPTLAEELPRETAQQLMAFFSG